MQTRLLACITGGLLGVVLASPLSRELSLAPSFAVIASSLAGVAAGCVVSILYDVFVGTAKPPEGVR